MNVAVVGAGTAGLAAALLLARRGAEVTVLERVSELGPVGAGLLLQPSGMAVLAAIGVLEPVLRRGARVDRLRGLSHRGRTVLSLHYADRRADLFGLGVHRGSLCDALVRAVGPAGIRLRPGVAAERLEALPNGLWALPDAGPEAFDLVIVADGARSTLRAQVGPVNRARPYRYGALWFIAEDPDQIVRGELFQVYRGTHRMLGFLPSGQIPGSSTPLTSVFWSLDIASVDALRQAGIDAWRAEATRLWPAAGPLIDQSPSADALVLAVYHDVVMGRTWRATDRGAAAVVLGDAAHAMSPQLGQGANLALLDAAVLVDHLDAHGALIDRTRLPAALDAYERARRGPVRTYQRLSRWLTPVFQSSWPVGWLRDLILGPLCHFPPVKRLMLNSLAGGMTSLLAATEPPRLDLRLPAEGVD